jgi:signal transduction histidine kinase/ligand-binding sensor domain-containing protein
LRRQNSDTSPAVCLYWLLAVLSLVSPALAQYRFDSWTTDNGLPQNSIQALRQTRDGYLWMTTSEGLARFDGLRFRSFNRENTPELTTNGFSYFTLLEDAKGCLWAGTWTGGAIRYCDGVFTTFTTKDGLPNNRVVRIDEDTEGTVWIFTDPGLAKWQNGRLIRVAPEPGSPFNDSLVTSKENVGADGYLFGLWRMEAHGWRRFAYGKWSHFPLPLQLADPSRLRISTMVEDSKRRVWYKLRETPGVYYCVKDGGLTIFHGLPPESFVNYQDREGNLWASDRDGRNTLWKDGHVTPIIGFSTPFIFRVVEDREGTLWIGTAKEGLYRATPRVIATYQHPGGSQWNVIEPILQDRAGDVWFGSRLGLFRFRNGRFDNFYREHSKSNRMNWDNIVSALYEDRDGTLWVGMWEGAARLEGGKLVTHGAVSRVRGRVNAIHRDRAGDLWLGGEHGLYRVHGEQLTRFGPSDGLSSDLDVQAILEDPAGRLWIGTATGLTRWDKGVFSSLGAANGLNITALYEDSADVLWIGTYDTGLNRLEQGKLTRYTSANGLYNNGVFEILEDDNGFFWISCHLGIYRVSKRALNDFAAGRVSMVTSTHFGKADGLVSAECSSHGQPAGFKARNGKLWFPTTVGLAVVDPKTALFNPKPPPVAIEQVMLDGRAVAFRGGLKVAPGQGNLEIQCTALSLIKSDQIRFRYRLDGLDGDWVNAGTRRTAYYSRIPPGKYTFRVIAANSDGVWNTNGAQLPIYMLRRFYETWWFVLLLSVAGASVLWMVWRRRIGQLERARAVQQAFSRQLIASQESERKRIAAELHDSLGQRLVMIKNLALLALRGAHQPDLLQRVETISEEASLAIGEMKEISYNLRPYRLDRLGLTKALEALVKTASTIGPTVFSTEVDDIDNLFPSDSEINFYRIVQEGVNNVVKHAHATEAHVEVRRADDAVRLSIRDNGIGFAVDDGARLKETGFGLIGIRERAKVLGGETQIRTAPGEGTTISIQIARQGESDAR